MPKVEMDDVAVLVVYPFRDIVEKGRAAVYNAGNSQPMLRAAQSLVKEGERALKRIEPLCKKHLDKYGSNFVGALKDNDEISSYRIQLTDLLWEFDEHLNLDGFDADKYAQLQALSRKAALSLYNILTIMKLEAPPKDTAPFFVSQLSPPESPLPLPASLLQTNPLAISHPTPGPVSSPLVESLADSIPVDDDANQLRKLMYIPTPSTRADASRAIAPEPESAPAQQPPRPPSTNPWDPQVSPVPHDYRYGDHTPYERRPVVVHMPDSPVDPTISPLTSVSTGCRTAASLSGGSVYDSDGRRQSSSSAYSSNSVPSFASRARVSSFTMAIPEESPLERAVKPLTQTPHTSLLGMSPYSQRHPTMSRRWSGESAASSGEGDSRQRLIVISNEPTCEHPPPNSNIDNNLATQVEQPHSLHSAASILQDQAGLEVVAAPCMPRTEFDVGLIPVESETSDARSQVHAPREGCTISTSSSFYQYKGFCQGAKAVANGKLGVKKAQKPVRQTLSRAVARCTGCLYELDFDEIERDVNMQDAGNFTSCGVGYRLRFLQKSHLPAKRVEDVLYGCVFCVQQGRTLDESDATVFFTTKALFNHLARHPRPLPAVRGIFVVEEAEIPEHLCNNYDVHFSKPPVVHPSHENHGQIAGHPTGIAREQARGIYRKRLLQDGSAALELAEGARITGIRWPSKHNGEWMLAWHDGVFAAAPMDMIKLDPPPTADIKMGGTSHVRAKARWKFAPRDKDAGEWLKFEKSETISNISWAYLEHWCWSGTNAKGKWGIFPQAFIDQNTVQEIPIDASGRRFSLADEKSKSLSMLAKLSVRRTSGRRPPSIAESTSSRESAFSGLRLSSRAKRSKKDVSGGGDGR